METGQKTTRKINNPDSFSIINLTINIGYNEIGFILYDNIENILLDSTDVTYKELANIDNLISKYFSENEQAGLLNLITVNHHNSLHTVVPKALFDKNNIKDYLKFNNSLLENDEYLYDIIKNNESVNVFIPIKFNIYSLHKYAKEVTQKHYTTKLINEIYKIEKNNTSLKKIYLEVSKNNFEGISFYKKMKFIGTHTRKNYFFIKNNHIDALAMVKTY